MSQYFDALLGGSIETWGSIDVRVDPSAFCARCDHPLASGVCISCGWIHCPLCGAAEDCQHALPAVERRDATDGDEDDDAGAFLLDDDGAKVDLPLVLPNPPTHLVGITGAQFVVRIHREQSTGPALAFRCLPESVRWHGNWTQGIPAPFRDEGILYELIHDARLFSRLEEEVWTRAARSAGTGLVAVERIPRGVLSHQLIRKRRWFTDDRAALLPAGRALREDWEALVVEAEASVRSEVEHPECPLCGEMTIFTHAGEPMSCGSCGAWECPYCGVNDIECGLGCAHSLGLVIDGCVYDPQVDLSEIPVSTLSFEQLEEIGYQRVAAVFGDLEPVLEAYDNFLDCPPDTGLLLLALAEHACPDVHVESFAAAGDVLDVPLCRDRERGRAQFAAALAKLTEVIRELDALAPTTPRDIEEEN